jgi:hypothetical protein
MALGRFHVLILTLMATLAACGGDADEASFTPVAGTQSAYCDAYRGWQAYLLDDAGLGMHQPNPAALRAYWNEYLILEETLLREAPAEIRDEVTAKVSGIRTLMTPLLEKYGFDEKRLRREGTAAERRIFDEAPVQVQEGQAVQHAYEDRVCGVASPPAAKVAFSSSASSVAYCEALDAYNAEAGKVASSRFDPEATRRFLASQRFTEQLEAMDATAPAELAADVRAENEWFRTRWHDVFEEFGYDVRRIWTEGTPEDRAVLTLSHPDVGKHAARTTAYEEQVCAR